MNRAFCYFVAIVMLFAAACGTNKKLSQENAEKAIRTLASTRSVSPIPGTWADCSFDVQSIKSIGQLSQFAETEATSVVTLCTPPDPRYSVAVRFVFQKDIDNQWFLTKVDWVEGTRPLTSGVARFLAELNQNLKLAAQ